MAAEPEDTSEKLTKKDYIWGGLGAAAVVPFTATTLFMSIAQDETTTETQAADPVEPQQSANDLADSNVFGALATMIALVALLTIAKEGTRKYDNVMVGFSTGVLATAITILSIFCASQLGEKADVPENTQKSKTEIIMDRAADDAPSRNDSRTFQYTP